MQPMSTAKGDADADDVSLIQPRHPAANIHWTSALALVVGCIVGSAATVIMTSDLGDWGRSPDEEPISQITFVEDVDGRRMADGDVAVQETIRFSSGDDGVPKFCWSCENAPSRGWNWNWGYGKCKCDAGWTGACCDVAKVITEDRWGPYNGDGGRGTFELYTQYHDNMHDEEKGLIYPKTGDTNVPDWLHGLWWMEGNPAAEEVASFGKSTWVSAADGGCDDAPDMEDGCSGSLSIKCWDSRTWSWADSVLGRQM